MNMRSKRMSRVFEGVLDGVGQLFVEKEDDGDDGGCILVWSKSVLTF